MGNEEPDGTVREDESIGLAISGGGLRATLFSLGVVLYLSNSGANKRIRLISSVSGGSITNAILALLGDFSKASPERVKTVIGRAARRIANEGTFFLPGRAFWIGLSVSYFVAIAILLALPMFDEMSTRERWSLVQSSWWLPPVIVAAFVLYMLGVFMLGRKGSQITAYSSFLVEVFKDDKAPRKQRNARAKEIRQMRLSSLPDHDIQHVFCATELVSGRPFYMSARRLTSPAFGSCEANIPLNQAIYASAAFPGVFPPLRLGTRKLGLRGGEEPIRPGTLVLADGGVYNNLGTDWFEDSTRPLSMIHDFGETVPVSQKIIVNASAPRRIKRIFGWWPASNLQSLMRIFGVMYENTVTPRLDALRTAADEGHVAVVDIAFSTGSMARAMCGSPDAGTKGRAKALAHRLGESSLSGYLDKIAVGSSGTRTKLSRIGEPATVQLLIHGYMSALVVCHAKLGTPATEIPDRGWFEDLVRPPRDNVLVDSAAPPEVQPAEQLPLQSPPKESAVHDEDGAAEPGELVQRA
ncbi:patatin-like phospholipase family protein [uncultured Microbacterium sp.]|uniref:patatin-like phospholipase family protein n=1 Tax=uncultured Microbacterium sp. TaxID=191216 RepID=UPI0028D045FA|nr:patatin-like phospholipase family protein [uncultured Microbacterium sp.]